MKQRQKKEQRLCLISGNINIIEFSKSNHVVVHCTLYAGNKTFSTLKLTTLVIFVSDYVETKYGS